MKVKVFQLVFCFFIVLFNLISNAQNEFSLQMSPTLKANVEWTDGPYIFAFSTLEIRFVDTTSGNPVGIDPKDFSAEIFMEDMDHLNPPIKIEQKTNILGFDVTGAFVVSEIEFYMLGMWTLRFRLKDLIADVPIDSGICTTPVE